MAIPWLSIELAESVEPGVYRAMPPDLDSLGELWVGYYIELHFEGGTTEEIGWKFPHML